MEITTVKLHKKTKSALNKFKQNSESYEDAIKKLISKVEHEDKKSELIEAYKNMNNQDIEILEEWETTSAEIENE